MAKSTSIVDAVSGLYLGLRAAEPVLEWAKGNASAQDVQDTLIYRFGGFGPDGAFAPAGMITTYGPVIGMQVGKKVVRWFTKKSFKLGPFRFP